MINISNILDLANYAFVLFFGITASFYFVGMHFEDYKKHYVFTIIGFGIIQLTAYRFLGKQTLYTCYPLLIHLPLILLIFFVFYQSICMSTISVLTAYLLCTPRKWIGTLVSSFFGYNQDIANATAILVTIPLLILVIKYLSSYIEKLKYENITALLPFLLLPLAYYILEYAFTVYTDLLYTGRTVIIDFVDSFIVLLYLILSIFSLESANKKNKAEHENLLLRTAAIQIQKEMQQISNFEKQAAIYRHDMRHHLNFISQCIRENQNSEALKYISEICTSLDNSKIVKYCTNEALNLIFSYYADEAKENDIKVDISVTAYDFSRFRITNLCSLFANAFENAIHACVQLPQPEDRYINLKLYEKNCQLCINMSNSYHTAPVFKNDIPTTSANGHGIGIQSMISVIEKYHGIYGFFAENGEFRFQASI